MAATARLHSGGAPTLGVTVVAQHRDLFEVDAQLDLLVGVAGVAEELGEERVRRNAKASEEALHGIRQRGRSTALRVTREELGDGEECDGVLLPAIALGEASESVRRRAVMRNALIKVGEYRVVEVAVAETDPRDAGARRLGQALHRSPVDLRHQPCLRQHHGAHVFPQSVLGLAVERLPRADRWRVLPLVLGRAVCIVWADHTVRRSLHPAVDLCAVVVN